eukprot:756714-Hanusia_phi.AAC.1
MGTEGLSIPRVGASNLLSAGGSGYSAPGRRVWPGARRRAGERSDGHSEWSTSMASPRLMPLTVGLPFDLRSLSKSCPTIPTLAMPQCYPCGSAKVRERSATLRPRPDSGCMNEPLNPVQRFFCRTHLLGSE